LLYAVVAFIVLWCALGGYATTEREYHIMAHAGKVTAAEIFSQRERLNIPPAPDAGALAGSAEPALLKSE